MSIRHFLKLKVNTTKKLKSKTQILLPKQMTNTSSQLNTSSLCPHPTHCSMTPHLLIMSRTFPTVPLKLWMLKFLLMVSAVVQLYQKWAPWVAILVAVPAQLNCQLRQPLLAAVASKSMYQQKQYHNFTRKALDKWNEDPQEGPKRTQNNQRSWWNSTNIS